MDTMRAMVAWIRITAGGVGAVVPTMTMMTGADSRSAIALKSCDGRRRSVFVLKSYDVSRSAIAATTIGIATTTITVATINTIAIGVDVTGTVMAATVSPSNCATRHGTPATIAAYRKAATVAETATASMIATYATTT